MQGKKKHFEIIDGNDFDKLFTAMEAIVKYNDWKDGIKLTVEINHGDFLLTSNGKD
jgi:hypothetical protein